MIELTGSSLTMEKVRRICYEGEAVEIALSSMEKVIASRAAVEKIVKEKKTIYGINTGFGKFSDVIIAEQDVAPLQLNLIRSHACGVGEPFPEMVSRAMILLRLNALLKGYSGVRPVLIEKLVELLNKGVHPVIPQQGSLGASGDLAPLSHLALVLIGEGEVFDQGKVRPASEVLAREGISPIVLQAKERPLKKSFSTTTF